MSADPLRVAAVVRAELESTLRHILGAGWPAWRLSGQVRDLAQGLAEIERDPEAVQRFTAGGPLTRGERK